MGPGALQPRRLGLGLWIRPAGSAHRVATGPHRHGVHAAYYLLGGGAINAVGHRWGRRPFDNKATNNQWLARLVVGEGLHNNHHAAATSSRLSLAKGEVDPAWWCILLLVRLRWATVRETTRDPRTGLSSSGSQEPPVGTPEDQNAVTWRNSVEHA